MRTRHVVTAVAALAVVGAAGFVVARVWDAELPNPFEAPTCAISGADGSTVSVDPTQASNAATIAAVGTSMDVPDRAVVVALATAFQESRLENIGHGDRDSIGLFQQRPSQGWGTEEEISDPRYSSRRFYEELLKVDGWEDMRVTDAAQAVQRSAYPEAYQKWAGEAAVLADAMLGSVDAAVACRSMRADLSGEAAVSAVTAAFGLDWDAGEAETDGETIRVSGEANGWQYAHWMVAYAEDLGVSSVSYDGRRWSAGSGAWERVEPGAEDGVTVRVLPEA